MPSEGLKPKTPAVTLDCRATDWSTDVISVSCKANTNEIQDGELQELAYFCNSKGQINVGRSTCGWKNQV
jgi:hypothetical protein